MRKKSTHEWNKGHMAVVQTSFDVYGQLTLNDELFSFDCAFR